MNQHKCITDNTDTQSNNNKNERDNSYQAHKWRTEIILLTNILLKKPECQLYSNWDIMRIRNSVCVMAGGVGPYRPRNSLHGPSYWPQAYNLEQVPWY